MISRRSAVVALAPLALAGCGWFGGDAPQNKTKAADTVEVAPKARPGEEVVTTDAVNAAAPSWSRPE